MASSGNFCTLNPLGRSLNTTCTKGNLYLPSVSYPSNIVGTMGVKTGKWYFEARCQNNYGAYDSFGVIVADEYTYKNQVSTSISQAIFWLQLESVILNGSSQGSTTPNLYSSATKIVGCALDLDNNKVYFHGNNTYVNSHNPNTGSGGYSIPSALQGKHFLPLFGTNAVGAPAVRMANFGQDSSFGGDETSQGNADDNGHGDFYYSPPTGFLAMCSANMPINTNQDPAQGTPPNNYFDAITYTGNGGTKAISELSFSPNMVWIKNRSAGDSWCVQDTINGVGKTKAMNSASAYASETDCITSFDSNGFTMSNDHKVNASGEDYVAYCFKESQEAGFDMFSYTGSGGGNQTVSHNLGETPKMVWIFLVSGSATDTMVYIDTVNMGTSYGIFPSLSNARQATSYVPATASSNITVGSSANATGRGYFAMLWAEREGFSKFDQYLGNGDGDGPFIYTGFRPKMVWWKNVNANENWQIRDTARITSNTGSQPRIYFNSSSAEGSNSTASPIDFLADGFKIRGTNSECNSNDNAYIYGAWADVPFKYNNTF